MLGRAALSLRLRPRTFPPPIRLALFIPQHQVRGYARDRKIPKDYKLPSSATIPEWQRQSRLEQKHHQNPQAQSKANEPLADDYQDDRHDEVAQNTFTESSRSDKSSEKIDAEPSISDLSPPPTEQPANEVGAELPKSLPDLTHGIPSTFAAEFNQARKRQEASSGSLNITEDPAEPVAGGGSDGLPRSSYISSSDQKKNAVFKYAYFAMAASIIGYTLYLGRNWETEEEAKKHEGAPSGWGFGLFYDRVKARLGSTLEYYSDPVTTKLLPDEEKDPNLRFPFTLVISLEDMLVHQEWTRETGWRIAKRPGVDYFLRYLSAYYEIVLFTSQPYAMAEQVFRKLDPFHMIRWPLFREATLYKDGGYIKDLKYLNRNLSKVLVIDTDPHHVKNQPENAIILPKWTGDPNDQTLVQLIPFLEYLATMGFDDARTVLKSFEGTYIPAEFARREKLLRQKFEEKEAEKRAKHPKRRVGGFGSLFGASKTQNPDGFQSADEAFAEGKMVWDQIRERGQKQYEMLEKQIREEGAKWLAEQAEEEKKLNEEAMKSMRTGFLGYFGFGGNKEEKS